MSSTDRAIAICGCIQHSWWAHRLAQHGEYRADRLRAATNSILCTDPKQPVDVFGKLADLRPGLDVANSLFGEHRDSKLDSQESALVTRYVGHLLRLGGTLNKHQQTLQKLGSEIDVIKADYPADEQGNHVPNDGDVDDLCQRLAGLYMDNLSPLTPRIMVQGNGIYLRNELFAAGIRTHLLAAVRAAVLWRQCGGRIWLLMFQRRRYADEIRRLLSAKSI